MNMDSVGSVGNLYLKESGFSSMDLASSKLESNTDSGFDRLFTTALKEKNRPQGAALNSGATDTEHASHRTQVIDRKGKLYEQCRELENFLVKNMLDSMRKTVDKSELSDSGFAGGMYEDMLYDEYAKSFTENAGLGLADQVYLELTGQRNKSLKA